MFEVLRSLKRYYERIRREKFIVKETRRVSEQAEQVGVRLRVNNKSKVNDKTILGDNVNFNGLQILGAGRVIIGNNFHSGTSCLFITQVHNYDRGEKIPYDDTYVLKNIKIEDQVWLGTRVIVLGGVTIGEGAVIQAGSVVTSDIPKFAIAGGHPCKVFKYRDIEHYKKLKSKQKFH